jgi:hypothetical protein
MATANTIAIDVSGGTPDPPPPPAPTKDAPAASDDTRDLLKGISERRQMWQGRVTQDQAVADEAEGLAQPPQLKAPPKQEAPTDPFQAFGQPAMWMAIFGSLLTRRPFTNAVLGAANVMHSTQQLDAAQAQKQFETWKIESENALKLAKFQQDAYKNAIAKLGTDIRGASADATVTAHALHDAPTIEFLQHHSVLELPSFLKARNVNGDAASANHVKLEKLLQEQIEQTESINEWDKNNPGADATTRYAAHAAIRKGENPDTVAAKQFSPPQEIEITDADGKKRKVLAEQDKTTGGWVTADEHRTPISSDGQSFRLLKGAEAEAPDVNDPGIQWRAKQIATYRGAPLTGYGATTPYAQTVNKVVAQLNPDYDATKWEQRHQAVLAFSAGKPTGNRVVALNTAVAHLDTQRELADALANNNPVAANAAGNFLRTQFGDPDPGNFDAAKGIVGQEVVKAIVAGGGGEAERQAVADKLSGAHTWKQLMGVIDTYQSLLTGQLSTLHKQYEHDTSNTDFDTMLMPRTIEVLEKGHGASVPQPGGHTLHPPVPSTLEGKPKLQWSPSKKQWRDGDGKLYSADGTEVQ